MGDNVAILSKTMGGDTIAATEVLTTAMNQFQVSLDDLTKAAGVMSSMMNVMAVAAKEGSAELPAIKATVEDFGIRLNITKGALTAFKIGVLVVQEAVGVITLVNMLACISENAWPLSLWGKVKALWQSLIATKA